MLDQGNFRRIRLRFFLYFSKQNSCHGFTNVRLSGTLSIQCLLKTTNVHLPLLDKTLHGHHTPLDTKDNLHSRPSIGLLRPGK